MNWWTIVKQGKILTLPKTQLRIKKPEKVEERKCKDELLAYNRKLETVEMILTGSDNAKYTTDTGRKQDAKYGGSVKRRLIHAGRVLQHHLTGKDYHEYLEGISYNDPKEIEKLPENICCAALDLLAAEGDKSSTTPPTTKTVGKYEIEVHKSDTARYKIPAMHRHMFSDDYYPHINILSMTIYRVQDGEQPPSRVKLSWLIRHNIEGLGADVDWR